MRSRLGLCLAVLALCAAGCSSADRATGPTYTAPTFGERDSVFTDAQLLAAGYSSYTVPSGFYSDPPSEVPVHYYVTNAYIVDSRHRPPMPWTELSTEDTAQARAWAVSSVVFGQTPVAGAPPLVTERYFEFADAPSGRLIRVRFRVHRSSYVTDVLLASAGFQPGRALATLQLRPIAAATVRPFIEYLWTQHENYDLEQKVLSSFATDTPSEIVHTIYSLELVQKRAALDRLQVRRFTYHVDKTSGVVTASPTMFREIIGNVR